MKKNKKIFIVLTLIILLIINFKLPFIKADSGWDTNYDSGGSWSSGSSSSWGSNDYSNDYSSSHRSSNSNSNIYIYFFLFFVYIIIYKIVTSYLSKYLSKSNNVYTYTDLSKEEITSLLPDMTLQELKQIVYDKFISIQNAWMDFDYDKLRELCTDELYNSYISQLEILKIKNGKNIMSNFKLNEIKIYKITKENENIVIQVYMNVLFYDYVINKSGKVIRGKANKKVNNNYLMTFIKGTNKLDEQSSCPHCGSHITNNASNICEYCDSVIVKSSSSFVLSKKTNINRR